jgi:hypothetical protein
VINLDSLLSLDAEEREIEVSAGEGRGTVRVTVRELPYAKHRAISLRYLGASQAYEAARGALEKLGASPLPVADAEALAGALGALWEAQRECVRWGVTGHREEDFLAGGVGIPFESTDALCNGERFRVASDRMLRLYQFAGGGRPGDAGELLPALAEAVLAFQRPGGADAAGPLPGGSASQ